MAVRGHWMPFTEVSGRYSRGTWRAAGPDGSVLEPHDHTHIKDVSAACQQAARRSPPICAPQLINSKRRLAAQIGGDARCCPKAKDDHGG
jgi:hypothetical protein